MYSALKICAGKSKSEDGFVLVIALIAVVILIAVGFYALTVSSKDIFIASRLIGERKALSAAEAGVQAVCLTFDPTMLSAQPLTRVDPTDDPNTRYYSAKPPVEDRLPEGAPGFDSGWVYKFFYSEITGEDTSYSSKVIVSVGLRPEKPFPGKTTDYR